MKKDVEKFGFFSADTNKFYQLLPTDTWPTILISGIRMHRTKNTDPRRDTLQKLHTLGKIYGKILDTCAGLGYTAILAAKRKSVDEVITLEKDKNVIKIAKQNPFSKELFNNPKIKLVIIDAFIGIRMFPQQYFDFIIHDPPRISLAHELYSQEFYLQLSRVIKNDGRMFHYIGEPGVKQGKNYLKGIVKRLTLAGFKKVIKARQAMGLLCSKA